MQDDSTKSKNGKTAAESLPDYTQFPALVEMDLPDLTSRYRGLHEAETLAKKGKDELKPQILGALSIADVKGVMCSGLIVERVVSKQGDKISAELLLEAGVPLATIQAATILGATYEYVQVKTPKAKK